MSNFESAVKRVMALNFDAPLYDYDLAYDVLLVKEHLRRKLLWSRALNLDHPSLLLFDVASRIIPTVSLNQDLEDILRHKYFPGPFMRGVCMSYLRWSLVENDIKTQSYHLPLPYEPLLLLCEAGGYFAIEHNLIFVWDCKGFSQGISMSPKFYDTSEPFITNDLL